MSVTIIPRITGTSPIEEKYVRTTRFSIINSGTSGSVALPPYSQVLLDDFGGGVDAYISEVSGGRPTFTDALDGSAMVVATSFDYGGNYVLTSAPASYPVAIIYKVIQQFKDLDSNSNDIIDGVDFTGAGLPSGGTIGQVLSKASSNNYDVGWVDQSGGGSTTIGNAVVDGDANKILFVDPSGNLSQSDVLKFVDGVLTTENSAINPAIDFGAVLGLTVANSANNNGEYFGSLSQATKTDDNNESGAILVGLYAKSSVEGSGSIALQAGISATALTGPSSTANPDLMAGVSAGVEHNGSGTITDAFGAFGNIDNLGSGTITNGISLAAGVTNTGGGTVTNGYALFCDTLESTNKYGAHIDVAGSVNVLREIQVKAESQVKFYDSDSSNYVGIKSPSALTGDRTATLQDASGTIAYLSDVSAKFTLPSLTSGSILFSDGTTISQDNTNLFWNNTTKRLGIGTASPASNLSVIQPVSTSGSPNAVTFTGGAHTTLTASTEATDVLFNLARTVQFSTGTIAFQRAFSITAPTYASVGASTITEAATVSISGPPVKGTNATVANAYGLYIGAAAIGAQTFGAGLSCFAPTGPATAYAAIFSGGTGGSSVRINGGLELINGSGYEINFTGAGNANINVANSGSELQFSTNNAGMYFSTNTLSTYAMNISTANRVRISGTSAATALLHISAGSATASTAPLKFTSGTNLTTAEAGAMEYNGTDLFFTKSGTTRGTVVVGTAVTTEVLVSDTSVTVTINGTTYKLLARA